MTTEQRICTNLETALKAISIANGYSVDISGNVFEWRFSDLGQSETPGIIWRDYLNEWEEDGEDSHRLYFQIAVIAAGNTSPATIRSIVQDIITAFYTLENKTVFDPTYISGCYMVKVEKSVERHEKRVAGAQVDCYVEYTTEIGII